MKIFLATVSLVWLLTGCSGLRVINSQVQSIATSQADAPALSGARYRYERLPSQAEQPQTAELEALADAALARVGLVRDDGAAQYSVLLGTRVQSYLADAWGDPFYNRWRYGAWPGYGHFMLGSGIYGRGGVFGFGMGARYPTNSGYRIEVSLLLRDLKSGLVAYETRAVNDGPWSDSKNILPAVLDAALKDFPTPAPGVRRVNTEIPR